MRVPGPGRASALLPGEAAADTRDVTRAYALLDHTTRDGVGLQTITGGKWCTFRQMAEVTVDDCAASSASTVLSHHLEPLPTAETCRPITGSESASPG